MLGAALFSVLRNGASGVRKALFFLVFPIAAMIFNPLLNNAIIFLLNMIFIL